MKYAVIMYLIITSMYFFMLSLMFGTANKQSVWLKVSSIVLCLFGVVFIGYQIRLQ